MPTNKIVLQTTEEFMSGYQPVYSPIYSLFLGRSRLHESVVGDVNFRGLSTIGDIRAKPITPKDTEIQQIAVGEGSKNFKKYFFANQFTVSNLQSSRGVSDVQAEVLDEHQKQMDDLVLLGEGTAANNVVNNGLYWSGDANYVLKSSIEIAKGTASDHLKAMYTAIMNTVTEANTVAGRKLVLIYGATAISKYNGIYATSDNSFSDVLGKALKQTQVALLPSEVTPASANGWMVINMDQIMLHYTMLPNLRASGINEEKMYAWMNFMLGSAMVEVQKSKGIIRQPVTFEV